jgi:late competence protein required for DNA uptake (superfamily II DNA/RNA helicase)
MPRIIIKYSKSYNNINNLKKNFYTNNKENLKSAININKLYKKNPIRVFCINCQKKSLRKFIKSHLIEYYVCTSCLHLNGKYKETEKFLKQLYSDNSGNNYKKNYLKDYEQRVKNIYIPKVNFLKTVINQKINLLDLGAGGGHFLKALEIKKIKARGVEPSKALSEL